MPLRDRTTFVNILFVSIKENVKGNFRIWSNGLDKTKKASRIIEKLLAIDLMS